MNVSNIFHELQKSFREKRMRKFEIAFRLKGSERILDVGGTPEIWRLAGGKPRVTILNMPRAGEARETADFVRLVHGDGCHIPFDDRAFDVVFSNSVIEHVGSTANQRLFAEEVRRTGRGYWVQTPNRWFPVEAHLLTPFVHWLPSPLRELVARRFTLWALLRRPAPDEKAYYVNHFLSDIHLLSADELQDLFPDATLLRERFFGMTKSLIAWRASGPG